MPVISFASSKGGAGKTTSAIILACELAEGANVVVIDADPARRLSRWSTLASLPKRVEVVTSAGERTIQDEIAAGRARASFVLIDLEGAASRLNSFAICESDLVIVPTGDEQQDADEAIETLAQVAMEGRARRREIEAAVLFTRTNAAVKSKLEKHINGELRAAVRTFATELNRRTAFSSLHNAGGGLRQLDRGEVSGIDKAIANAEAFAAEVVDMLEETHHAAVA
ncbi:chromosome partitioning protein ParA [Acuticoccus sediminis]|uniref:Chromosome partitioning protein ParA n=1 Tax=Acuticoccus sediminis TaxID=2184697 RepID=A0A8B2NL75_9HYPH|nr:ParA family protein [Acuticoccus sediminis]RAH95686.1 chromosome partitioning protein ParA [Acuticoccus sediminis]